MWLWKPVLPVRCGLPPLLRAVENGRRIDVAPFVIEMV